MRLQHTLIRDGIGIVVNIGAVGQVKVYSQGAPNRPSPLPSRIRRASYEKTAVVRETAGGSSALWLQTVPSLRAPVVDRHCGVHQEGTAMKSDYVAVRRICSDTSIRWMHCFCYFCLVLSLPWSIWLSGGWFGVLLHFQAASGAACVMERMLRKPQRRRQTP